MILEIDYGNTRLKWRLLRSKTLEVIAWGAVTHPHELILVLEKMGCTALVFCRACSVRTRDENTRLSSLINDHYAVEIIYAHSSREVGGVINGYEDAQRLGVDRWLAVIAGYTQVKSACLIIDCGTAITADFITADGRHLGGSIAPGLKMLNGMLKSGTQLVVDAERLANSGQCLGRNTQAAIAAGVRAMVTGFIQEQLKLARAELGPLFSVLCTGGDSALVSGVLDTSLNEADLVFAGLSIVCPYDAKE
ncbi:MAG TPA: type III pantothenate kinase [Pseudomonadales bacterium]|nr:type III pantothenate kinase [Gammaproteobacteria bacterium]HUH57570.1 type III pantothenate kinase [Pseudomonadales bacterium]